MPLFSVVIPTFNRASLLGQALLSLERQTYRDHEVIVVDDGSTDNTRELVGRHPGVKLLAQNNRGPGSARNRGANASSGEYLAFLDSDDLYFPWSLEVYAQVIGLERRPAFLAGRVMRFRDEVELSCAQNTPVRSRRFDDYLASGDAWRWWGASSFVVRADVFRAVGGFTDSPVNGEDADLALRLGEAQGFVQVEYPATFGYREHSTNVTGNLVRSLAGAEHMLNSESSGRYPGGRRRARERRQIMSRTLRPLMLSCLDAGDFASARRLFRRTLVWNLELGRWRFLLGFPLVGLQRAWSRRLGPGGRT